MSWHCSTHDSGQCPQAEESADAAVKKVFAILGVDIDNPKDVEEFRQDLRFGGRLRKASDHGFLAMVAAVFVAVLAVLWVGITSKISGGAA